MFSIKTLSPIKFRMLLKYLPFFLFFYLINSLLLNSFTRMRGASEGIKFFNYVPYPKVPPTTSALAGILQWNLLFILPIAAVFARLCFRKTGSIWRGGFIVSLIATLFAISNTVSSAGVV